MGELADQLGNGGSGGLAGAIGSDNKQGGLYGALMNAVGEARFRAWYTNWALQGGLDLNPYAPEHNYDYKAAYKSGAFPKRDESGTLHWPSEFKGINKNALWLRIVRYGWSVERALNTSIRYRKVISLN